MREWQKHVFKIGSLALISVAMIFVISGSMPEPNPQTEQTIFSMFLVDVIILIVLIIYFIVIPSRRRQ